MNRGLLAAAVVGVSCAAVLVAARPARRGAEEWERVKADVRTWTADNDAYTERLKRGEPRDDKYAAELVERMRALNRRYEAARKW